MKRLPPLLTYSLLRVVLIVVPLAILLIVVPFAYWPFSVIAAVLIGLCLSYLLLRKQRNAASTAMYERRQRGVNPSESKDDDAEDAVADAVRASGAATTADSDPAASEGERGAEEDGVEQPRQSGELKG